MAEELYFKINSDVSSAVKGTEDFKKSLEGAEKNLDDVNSTLKEQKDILLMLQKEQVNLEQAQAKMSDWEKHISGASGKLSELKLEIKDQRLAVKDLTNQQKEAADTVKDLSKANEDNSLSIVDDIKNYKVMGISINGISKAFGKLIPASKAAFATIKAGMISTGVGALVVAVGSLVAWFLKTKKGAESLTVIFKSVGAVVNVLVDRLIKWGKAIYKLVTFDISGAWKEMKGTFKGFGEELAREVALTISLTKQTQALADAERTLSVETAKRRADIEELKQKADDLTLSEEERLQALNEAAAIEKQLMAERISNAEQAVRIQQQQMTMSDNMAEDLQKLADLEIKLANIRRESAGVQRTVQTKANRIRRQTEAAEKAAHKRWVERQNEKIKKQNDTIKQFNEIFREEALHAIKSEQRRELTQAAWKRDERQKLIEETVFDEKKKEKLIANNLTFFETEKNRIKIKYKNLRKERDEQEAAELLAIQNEVLLATDDVGKTELENQREHARQSIDIEEALALKSIEGKRNEEELRAQIEEKYRLQREELGNQEAEQDKERAKEVAAFKTQLLADALGVAMQFMEVQAAGIEQDYKKEMKAAKGNKKAQEKIEKDFEAKRRKQAKKMKAMKIAMAIVDTYQSAISAYAAGMSIGGPAGLVLGPVSAALAIAAGLANVAMIEKQPLGGGGGGGGGAGGAAASGGGGGQPSGQMMSGAFDISGGTEPEPVKAYVVTDEMTDSQDQLENIRRRATI